MKWILPAVLGLVLSPVGVFAQTAPKPAAKPVAKDQPAPLTNEETNIRAYIELLRSDVKDQKTQIMGVVMQLDASDAAKFWPIYKDFEAEFEKTGDSVVGLVKNYAKNYNSMTNEVADQLATQLLNIEQQRNDLKRKYYGKFKTAIDAITAARFLQVENQLEKVVDLQVAASLPVIADSQGGQK